MNKEIVTKLDNIEEVLKMLLVNNVYDREVDKIQESILCKAREVLEPYGLTNIRLNYIEKKYYIFAELKENSLNNIKSIYSDITVLLEDIKLVLSYEKLHPKRKQAFADANISFSIKDGEIRIF